MAQTATFDDLNPAATARLRVERLLNHFRRFLAPDDDKVRSLEKRLASLQSERLPALPPNASPPSWPERLATFQN